MRRLLTGPIAYLDGLARAARSGWDRFVFTPADPTPLGLVRVATGALAFWSLFVYGLDLAAYLGPDGWVRYETLLTKLGREGSTHWSFWPYVPAGMVRAAWVACLAVLALFTAGLWSRLTAVLAWAIYVSTVRRATVSVFGFDQMISTWLLYLAVAGASGQAVSIDRFLARWRRNRAELARRARGGWYPAPGVPEPSIAANISTRLIQCHLVLIYGMAGLAKLHGDIWWTGDAFWNVAAAEDFRIFDLTWLAAFPYVIQFCTHAGLATELSYPILIWVRPLRPLMVGLAVMLHMGIGLTLGLWEFGLAMVAANLAFASGPWLRGLVAGRTPGAVSGRVLYDGACPKCRASMALIAAADPDRLIEPIDLTAADVAKVHPSLTKDACLKAMHLVRADGRVESGYDAVMTVLGWVPLTWAASLVRYVPGVSAIGRRAYNWVASSRSRDVCDDEACGLHPPAPHANASSRAGRPAR